MRASFTNLGSVGVVADQPAWELQPEAWSDSLNVRYRNGSAEVFQGQTSIFGIPPNAPYRLMPVSSNGVFYWVYPGITKVYATEGVSHGDITPNVGVSASYSATDALLWNGGAFNGYMTLNTGRQIPLTWVPGLGNRCVQMDVSGGWPSALRADVIRSYRNYLIALRCTEANYNERLMRWSNAASPGNLPTSWDYTDVTNDSGRIEFGQTQDKLVDCMPMRDINVVYKQNYTWAMTWVGGNANPFQFRQVFSQVGLLAEWCVAAFDGKHICLTNNDVVVHDLNSVQSVINTKMRKWLFNQINPSQVQHCFISPHYSANEIWICFPESGHTYANKALIWNWAYNTLQVRDLGTETPHIAWGVVSASVTGSNFDGLTGSFDGLVGPFDTQSYNASQTNLLMAVPSGPRLVQIDSGMTFDGNAITASLTRESLPLDADVQRYKRIKRIYPRVIGTAGAKLQVFLGRQLTLVDPIAWGTPTTFTVGVDRYINVDLRTPILSIRFQTTDQLKFFGYDVEYDAAGYY